MKRRITDVEAVTRIHRLLDGKEWTTDTTCKIADIILDTGRGIQDYE
jgi:hypothetical protein